ncbi:MAG: hypothetical protein ACKOA5_08245, partial [Actinomycetota bacterium]
MSDWNPLDPDAESVHYDLGEWSLDQRAAVAEVFAEAEVPHAWVGDEVTVPAELEEVADALLDRLEQEFAIDGGAFVRRGSAAAIDEASDDEITEYELDEWADNERSRLSELLVASGIPFKWEGALLVTLTEFEDTVDELLDAVEAGDVTIVDSVGPRGATISAGGSELSGETLTQMFLAAERLQRDPLDANGLASLVQVLEDVEDGGVPFGVPVPAWRQAVELADQLAEALA